MASSLTSFSPFLLVLVVVGICYGTVKEDRRVHIVYMGALSKGEFAPTSQHLSMLEEVLEDSSIADSFVQSYHRSFNGFAAKLNEQERKKLASKEGVVSVFPSRTLQLQTTRSWDFIGFSEGVERKNSAESDLIVGVLDSGIWPESESSSDKNFGPPPKKWKGACNGGHNFRCNNKISGARFYPNGSSSARDMVGHGAHTSSIITGDLIPHVDFYGLAGGTARGGVPSARIAVYKVCDLKGCTDSDILAGFDDAIANGVDIISASMGPNLFFADFDSDALSIGSFHAMRNGILLSQAAGNEGPRNQTVSSFAPWVLSVAASITDRRFIDKVVLGDGKVIKGNSINSFTMNGTNHPLVHGKGGACSQAEPSERSSSQGNDIDNESMKGKIVLCNVLSIGGRALRHGAIGAIMIDDEKSYDDVSFVHPLPAIRLSTRTGELVKSYMNSTRNPTANILKSEAINDSSAPRIASFSSRGPNGMAPDILKPDMSAPGVDILAAYPLSVSPSTSSYDKRRVKFNIMSGTSMACPHATAAALYVKSFHPDWSPSAIKSALMTTARPMNVAKNPDAEFAYGAGNIDPVKAINPGLVYEIQPNDYIKFLCNIGWTTKQVRLVTGDNSSCEGTKGTAMDLNYPSMTVHLKEEMPGFGGKLPRTVKNVGSANSTYKASITTHSEKIKIRVVPSVLSFTSLNEVKSFVVIVSGSKFPQWAMASASLEWSDGTHTVRSPIVVHSYIPF